MIGRRLLERWRFPGPRVDTELVRALSRGAIDRLFTSRIGNPLQRSTQPEATSAEQIRATTIRRHGGAGGCLRRPGRCCGHRRQRGFRRRFTGRQVGIGDSRAGPRLGSLSLHGRKGQPQWWRLGTRCTDESVGCDRVPRDSGWRTGRLVIGADGRHLRSRSRCRGLALDGWWPRPPVWLRRSGQLAAWGGRGEPVAHPGGCVRSDVVAESACL